MPSSDNLRSKAFKCVAVIHMLVFIFFVSDNIFRDSSGEYGLQDEIFFDLIAVSPFSLPWALLGLLDFIGHEAWEIILGAGVLVNAGIFLRIARHFRCKAEAEPNISGRHGPTL